MSDLLRSRDTGRYFRIDYDASIRTNVTNLKKFVTETCGVPWEDFAIYRHTRSLFKDFYFRTADTDEKGTHKMSTSGGNNNLVFFLLCIQGLETWGADYKKTHDLMKDNNLSYNSIISTPLTVGNITVKTYNNGRVDLKGLTKEHEQIIERMIRTRGKLM